MGEAEDVLRLPFVGVAREEELELASDGAFRFLPCGPGFLAAKR